MKTITVAKLAAAVLTAASTPWITYLGSAQEITPRWIMLNAIVSLVAGVTAGAAYLSTSVADDQKKP